MWMVSCSTQLLPGFFSTGTSKICTIKHDFPTNTTSWPCPQVPKIPALFLEITHFFGVIKNLMGQAILEWAKDLAKVIYHTK